MPLSSGTRLGPYEVLGRLGAGGMGEVYRARDARLDRDVAIKVLPEHVATDAASRERFEREAKAVAALSHPNILSIFELGDHDGVAYSVTELLEGETLRLALARGRLPSRRALEYAQQIAQGLAAAHEKGIVHRDVKPENLFVTVDARIKILDAGPRPSRPRGSRAGGSARRLAARRGPCRGHPEKEVPITSSMRQSAAICLPARRAFCSGEGTSCFAPWLRRPSAGLKIDHGEVAPGRRSTSHPEPTVPRSGRPRGSSE